MKAEDITTNIFTTGRRTGKTYKLLHLADNQNGYIVCRSRQESERLMKEAKKLGLKINKPITHDDLLENHVRRPIHPDCLHIDDSLLLLARIAGKYSPVKSIAL